MVVPPIIFLVYEKNTPRMYRLSEWFCKDCVKILIGHTIVAEHLPLAFSCKGIYNMNKFNKEIAATGAWPGFRWETLLLMSAGGAIGGYVGSALSRRSGQRHIEWTLGCALVLIMGVCAYNVVCFLNG